MYVSGVGVALLHGLPPGNDTRSVLALCGCHVSDEL
jgi:hypothetical protein